MDITNKEIQNNNNLEVMKVKKYKSFKDYYEDEAFRRRHLEYLATPLKCECGVIVQRGYLNAHRKTKKHLNSLKYRKENYTKNLVKIYADIDINKILFYLDQLKKFTKQSQGKEEIHFIIDKIKKHIKKIAPNDKDNDNCDSDSDDYDDIEYMATLN